VQQRNADNDNRPAEFDDAILQWLPFLHKMAARLERNKQDREDLVNETVATALKRWTGYKQEGSLPGWLAFQMRERVRFMRRQRSVRAASYDAERRHYGKDGHQYIDALIDSIGTPARQEDIVCARQVVDALTGRDGDVVLRHAMGDTLEEIGAGMGVTRERARQLEVKARERLMKVAA
jgi:RNA polymerase sigma factor (sigma-70 family)